MAEYLKSKLLSMEPVGAQMNSICGQPRGRRGEDAEGDQSPLPDVQHPRRFCLDALFSTERFLLKG
jgi:hypothetical protein